jgi:hypothetical protein
MKRYRPPEILDSGGARSDRVPSQFRRDEAKYTSGAARTSRLGILLLRYPLAVPLDKVRKDAKAKTFGDAEPSKTRNRREATTAEWNDCQQKLCAASLEQATL